MRSLRAFMHSSRKDADAVHRADLYSSLAFYLLIMKGR